MRKGTFGTVEHRSEIGLGCYTLHDDPFTTFSLRQRLNQVMQGVVGHDQAPAPDLATGYSVPGYGGRASKNPG